MKMVATTNADPKKTDSKRGVPKKPDAMSGSTPATTTTTTGTTTPSRSARVGAKPMGQSGKAKATVGSSPKKAASGRGTKKPPTQ